MVLVLCIWRSSYFLRNNCFGQPRPLYQSSRFVNNRQVFCLKLK